MKTDVRETEDTYELDIDLPGFKKEEVNLELKDGYLTIQAAKGLDKEEPEKKGKYIRQERYAGACSRSFYVGEHVEPEDIRAKFENGIFNIPQRNFPLRDIFLRRHIENANKSLAEFAVRRRRKN